MGVHLYILTGASRGLGLAMAQQLLQPGHGLLCMARHANPDLAEAARQAGVPLEQWTLDLRDGVTASARLRDWMAQPSQRGCASATLINNAAALTRIAPLSDCLADDLTTTLRVGLEAPLLLSAAFLAATRDWTVPRKVLNISSGLGRRPMASQTGYGAIKAGMDHFTRCLALEEAQQPHGARVCSLAPGVIDTDMQTQLRSTPPKDFPDQARFEQLKAQGLLSSPEAAAQAVLAYLARPDFGAHPIADVREA
ncbi:MAG: SDR family NAD(P)-dependent oxidoreductase [Betaproteobacteria bacterium]|nr:SDR family NAD(P)-dependent oxidoreductase [Betaproteobacteria bacterium]